MSESIEALRTRLDQATDVYETIDTLNALAWELRYSDPQEGQELTQQALDLASNVAYALGIARSRRNRGYFLQQQSRYAEALSELLPALATAEKEGALEDQTLILWSLGTVYERLTNYPAAVEAFFNLSELCTELDDLSGKAQALNGLGVVYEGLDELEKALSVVEEALALYEELGMRRDMGKALNNLVLIHRRLEHYDQALACGQQALDIADETDHKILACHCHNNVGTVHLNRGDLSQALAHFEQSLTLSRAIAYVYTQIYALRHIGMVHREQGDADRAIAYLHQALETAEKVDAKSERFECHHLLSQIYQDQGDLDEALGHYKQFHRLKQQVFNTKADQTIKSLQLIHDVEAAQREAELIRQKNAALREYTRQLEASNAELDAFAHTVAHDLKNPVTAMLGFSKVLVQQYEQLPEERILRALHIMVRSARKMDAIIEALLLLAGVRKVEEITLHPLDTGAIVREARERLADLLADRDVTLTLPDAWPVALGYAPWVEEVWVNYLSNAAKYGGTPPEITLGWDRDAGQPDALRFWVQDRGAGIPPEAQARLFAPFERLDQMDAIEGHGLGLSIVRRIVEKLGGTVGVESALGAGSRFWFTLPAAG